MFYHIFDYLEQFDFPGAGMFQYITFRSACAVILSLLIATVVGKAYYPHITETTGWGGNPGLGIGRSDAEEGNTDDGRGDYPAGDSGASDLVCPVG